MNARQNELQKGQSGTTNLPEPTHAGPVLTPAVDIYETDQCITVLADMPGVTPENLTIDLRENVLSLVGRVHEDPMPGESVVLQEHRPGTFLRQFTLSEAIDQARIDARLTDGVLRLDLPKVERVKPRQIAVKSN